jgi:DNA-binding response OmpR family regulator
MRLAGARRWWHHAGKPTPTREHRVHVLIVTSGSQVTRQVLTALADGPSVSYDEVWSPQRALALLDEGETAYDIVVADNDTTPTGGFYLVREMKARVRMGQAMPPVVLLVAREQDDYLARWAETDAWVLKPVDSFDLAEAIEALVERRPMPVLPGVKTFAELGAIHGPGQVGELPPPEDPRVEPPVPGAAGEDERR